MQSEKEVFDKYPQSVVDKYFSKGILYDWDGEYFEIAWQYEMTCFVLLDLFKEGIVVKHIEVLIKDDFLTLVNDDWPGWSLPHSSSNDYNHKQNNIDLCQIEESVLYFLNIIIDFKKYKKIDIDKYYFSLFF